MGTIAEVKIKFSGFLDVGSFYQTIIDFLDSNGFSFKEKKFKYKETENSFSVETEIEFKKEYEKDIKVEGKIELKIEDAEDIVIKKGNLTKKLQKVGNLEIKIKADYIDEYGKDIEGQLNKILLEIYKNTLAKQHFKNIEKKAKEEMKELIKEIKKQMNLHKYIY
ncbi:MAG: hypothetical protein ABGW69_00270 [Nanoarchaeota archaeon]